MTTLAYQLYCSRNWPLDETLKMLSGIGYAHVEGYGNLMSDVPALERGLKDNGLTMLSTHYALDALESDPDKAVETARTLGVGKVFVPHIGPDDRPNDAKGWQAFGKRLAEAGKPILDAGLIYGWHNHDFELADLDGSDRPLDFIANASDDMMLELDLGWVARAGHDPKAWIGKYSGRISAAHIKDLAPEGTTDEDGWADVGHGTLDWMPIVAALNAAGVDHLVAEHDNPSDHDRFARRTFETVSNF